MKKIAFPEKFLWGVGSSSYQVEGNNFKNDWYRWELKNPKVEKTGIACDQYNLYPSDFKLAKDFLHNNIHRISIEWSRIFPEKGKIDREELNHYKKVLKTLKMNGLKVMLTLHHYTNPVWFADLGGWERKENIKYFLEFSKVVINELGSYVDYWLIFNEPNVYVYFSYLTGKRYPEKKNILTSYSVYKNLAEAHKKVYGQIHKYYPSSFVGTCSNFTAYKTGLFFLKPLKSLVEWIGNFYFLHLTHGYNDYVGVNYYQPYWFGRFKNNETLTDFGWEIYPKGIYEICKDVYSRYKLPIIVTENGIADADDDLRPKYLTNHLYWLHKAIEEGVDIRGYLHWTLIDNIEWESGRTMKFGLFETNFKTLERTPRKSAYLYAEICKTNNIETD